MTNQTPDETQDPAPIEDHDKLAEWTLAAIQRGEMSAGRLSLLFDTVEWQARNEGAVPVEAVWLRSNGRGLDVLVERNREWFKIISESKGGPISHIAERSGIVNAPRDTL